jgi:hypothetical protein
MEFCDNLRESIITLLPSPAAAQGLQHNIIWLFRYRWILFGAAIKLCKSGMWRGPLEGRTASVLCTTFSVDELLQVLADPSISVMQVEQPPGALYTCLSKRSLFGASPYGGSMTVLFCLCFRSRFCPLKGNKERTHSLEFSHAGKWVVSGCWNS